MNEDIASSKFSKELIVTWLLILPQGFFIYLFIQGLINCLSSNSIGGAFKADPLTKNMVTIYMGFPFLVLFLLNLLLTKSSAPKNRKESRAIKILWTTTAINWTVFAVLILI